MKMKLEARAARTRTISVLKRLFGFRAKGHDSDTLDVVISSSAGAETIHFRIRKQVVMAILGGLALVVLLMLGLGFASGSLLRQVARARTASAENTELRRQLLRLNELENQVGRLEATRKALLRVAGVEDRGSVMDSPASLGADTTDAASYEEWAEPESTLSVEDLKEITRILRRSPLEGSKSRGFGEIDKSGILHTGIDLPGDVGTVIRAPGDGIVSEVGTDTTLGQVLVLSHGANLETLYGHNSRVLVRAGDTVTEGQPIAEVGNTGLSSGPHLHFEIRWYGRSIDPAVVFKSLQ